MEMVYDRVYYYNLSVEQKARLVSRLKFFLDEKKVVKLAWLFGSITRRAVVRDVDVAVYTDPQVGFDDFLRLNSEIEGELRMPVDLLEIRQVPSTLKDNIIKKGQLIKGTKSQQKKLLLE